MTAFTAFTTLMGRDEAEALGEALEVLEPEGVGVFEIEDGSGRFEVAGYFTEKPDIAALALIAMLHEAGDFVISDVPDTDWVAHVQRGLQPVEAGRFFLYGSHDADKVPEGKVALLIEAAMAFGTGHHGTTLGCLRLLDRLAERGFRPERVADIGCGTAVLAMAAAKIWPEAEIVASDIDPLAVEVAEANLAANGMAGKVTCIEAVGFDHAALKSGKFDLIFANILKGPLVALAPELTDSLEVGGKAILSGLLNEQFPEIVDTYGKLGFIVDESEQILDWTSAILGHS